MDKFTLSDESNILEDMQYIANIAENNIDEEFNNNSFVLDINEIVEICEYLENPIKKGVWFFKFLLDR